MTPSKSPRLFTKPNPQTKTKERDIINTEILKSQLTELRLLTAASEIETVIANQKKAVTLSWVSELLERETDARRKKTLKSRIKKACVPEITTLESFDFSFNPDIDEEKIRDLATLKFVDQNQIALFLGAPGVGKTHLALAIGVLAVQDGASVYCTSAKRFRVLPALKIRLKNLCVHESLDNEAVSA